MDRCVVELEVCNCDCHKGIPMNHFVSCCEICPSCGRNIKSECYQAHLARCNPEKAYEAYLESFQ